MRLSTFFEDLKSAYEAELDDLMTDSAGHDVLAKRLQAKRGQLPQLLPMIECNPEMVAVAFHGGMRFLSSAVMRDVVAQEPEDLPSWSTLLDSVELAPWAETLAGIALDDPNGERFMVVTACLEYLQGTADRSSESGDRQDDGEDDAEGSDDQLDRDLDEAGADWLSEQGFDRKDRFAGD
ncbi:conserved hypothetical protein [Candidatus Accumulibacter aalborgensis]|uniref:Uncharacterized protein n=1 Tax=Candidatus Accumulibacter aalborgensis TaxID=1860102 RepID=A0A1A8XVG2_9PROT|nr:hypothetical protein [Candidatus Accumulibacter aalborgensis]SBT09015.1 conserved hypothetical protein [Candidatus Accumulibacter aalborgensis]